MPGAAAWQPHLAHCTLKLDVSREVQQQRQKQQAASKQRKEHCVVVGCAGQGPDSRGGAARVTTRNALKGRASQAARLRKCKGQSACCQRLQDGGRASCTTCKTGHGARSEEQHQQQHRSLTCDLQFRHRRRRRLLGTSLAALWGRWAGSGSITAAWRRWRGSSARGDYHWLAGGPHWLPPPERPHRQSRSLYTSRSRQA